MIPIVGFFIVLGNLDGQLEYNEYSWPLKYKYHELTKGKTILDSNIEDGALRFVLENENHEVTSATLVGFNKKVRTDVDEIVVDLNSEEILIPYKK